MSDDAPGSGCIAGNEGCCGLWTLASFAAAIVAFIGVLAIPRRRR